MNIENDEVFGALLNYWTLLIEQLMDKEMAQQIPVLPPCFNPNACSDAEVNDLMAQVWKTDRQNLTARKREKVHQYAIAELPTKFSLLTVSDDKEQLSNTYNIMRQKQEFFAHLDKFDMAEMFTNILIFDAQGNISQGDEKSLRDNSTGDLIEEVAWSNNYYNKFGQDYDVQDLNWYQELLENSCDAALWDKVMENLALYPQPQHGGPLFYHIMMGLIMTTAEATGMMVTRITTMKICYFQGEDVSKAVSSIRGALQHLETAQAVCQTISKTLLSISLVKRRSRSYCYE